MLSARLPCTHVPSRNKDCQLIPHICLQTGGMASTFMTISISNKTIDGIEVWRCVIASLLHTIHNLHLLMACSVQHIWGRPAFITTTSAKVLMRPTCRAGALQSGLWRL